ncbi:MAG: sigma-70 family RNA polymerase sigma factor [Phycisphaeraceae bacterium]|nr:sigma-70 family RNA polymerase sigma factor [Phycisphaeraceae bacterium]
MTKNEEEKLVRRWLSGDLHARDELIRETEGALNRAIRGFLRARAAPGNIEADDFCQEVLRRAMQNVATGEYRRRAGWLTYCYSIAVKLFREEQRRLARFRPSQPLQSPQYVSPVDSVRQRELTALLIRAIRHLPRTPDQPLYEIFCLFRGIRIYDDRIMELPNKWTHEQIGSLYGYSRAWASKHYTRALQQVCEALKGKDNS